MVTLLLMVAVSSVVASVISGECVISGDIVINGGSVISGDSVITWVTK